MASDEPTVSVDPAAEPEAEAAEPPQENPESKTAKTKKAKEPKAKKPAAARKPPTHPPYIEMITEAIVVLKEKTGSSQYAIAKFVEEKHKQLPANFKKLLLVHLKKFVAAGKLVKVRGSFKLPPSRSSPPKPMVPVPAAAKTAPTTPKAAAKPKETKTTKAKKAPAKPKASASKPEVAAKPKGAPAKPKVTAKPKGAAKPRTVTKPKRRRSQLRLHGRPPGLLLARAPLLSQLPEKHQSRRHRRRL